MSKQSNKALYDEMEEFKSSKKEISVADIDEMTRNTSDEHMTMLLDYYEEKTGKDYFADANKKLGVEEEIKTAEQEQGAAKVAGDSLDVDDKVKAEIAKEEEEKNRPLTSNERLAILLKAQYMANLERYTADVLKAQKAQIDERSFAMEDRINTRVVLARAYGESRATAYQNVSGQSILSDPEVKEAIDRCEKRLIDGNKVINKNLEKDSARVNELQEKINYLEEQISNLTAKALDKEKAEFDIEMEHLSKELNDAELELKGLNPDSIDLERDMAIENINNAFEDQTLGDKSATVPHQEITEKDVENLEEGSQKDEIVKKLAEEARDDKETDIHTTTETLDKIDRMIDKAETWEDIQNIYTALGEIDNQITMDEFDQLKADSGAEASNSEIKAKQEKNQDENANEFNNGVSSANQEPGILKAKDVLRGHVNELRKQVKVQNGKVKETEEKGRV